MEVTIRHHALESGCFVINATVWLTEEQIASAVPAGPLQGALRGGCFTAIVTPEGRHLATPLVDGEGAVVADLDFALIDKRKRMMDSVGHYARPEILSLLVDTRAKPPMHAHFNEGEPDGGQRSTPSERRDADHRTAIAWAAAR